MTKISKYAVQRSTACLGQIGICTLLSAGTLAMCRGADLGLARRIQFREPEVRTYNVSPAQEISSTATKKARLARTSWTSAVLEGSTNMVQLGSRVVLQLEPGRNLDEVLAGRTLTLSRRITSTLFILQAADSQAAIDSAEGLSRLAGVIASYPVMRRPFKRRNPYSKVPNDPLFPQQWHLENRGTNYQRAGLDLNVRAAWPLTRGENVVVAVADDGFQLDHPELVSRSSGQPHYNFYESVADGGPGSSDANHATAVAGLIGAEGNNASGVTGVAPGASLASWVIFGASSVGDEDIADDEQLMDMFQYASNRVSVQNHSWGSATTSQSPIGLLGDLAISNAVTQGRSGKGVVIVRAGGNEREELANGNDDGYGNDPRVIAVGAVRKDGRVASYSSPGACLLLAAPSGDLIDSDEDGYPDAPDPEAPDVLTTDRTAGAGYNADTSEAGDYAFFDGTSASSPQIAGVAALVLAANPRITYRDLKQILLHSARHYDLADPDVRLNGAGFRVSHNVGFGVPDAGFAVELAKMWSNRPPASTITLTNITRQDIADDALRLVCAAPGLPGSLSSIRTLPSLGLHPDDPTPAVPLVYLGEANEEIARDLRGKAALIQRGSSYFSEKIARVARAGALFAVIFNNRGTDQIQFMGGTAFAPIPVVSIGQNDGVALRDFIASQPETTGRLQLTPAVYRFRVTNSLVCENVGVRLKTTHTSRSDVRITLVSPMVTRSILETINLDTAPGPTDWTYWSTQHFYESSMGEWRLEVSDERNSILLAVPSSATAATGAVTFAELIVQGVAITDTDGDGLDDGWEMRWFGNLDSGPKDDSDQDGYSNAREQVLGTDPTAPNGLFRLELAELTQGYWRFSWPSASDLNDTFQISSGLEFPWANVTTAPGQFPVNEFVAPIPSKAPLFYRIRREY